FLDNGQYIVVCATKQQLKAIPELTYFEIDMAFKRIHTLTFARIFTNIEMADAYQNLFEDLFNCIEKDIGEIFNFYYIHRRGLGCIIADQHKGQAL
ncbi:21377_t:CDS:2, partial [Rhizophagus irregularis]